MSVYRNCSDMQWVHVYVTDIHVTMFPHYFIVFLINLSIVVIRFAFSALTLLVGCQEGHPARKNVSDEVLGWLSSGAKCK